ncbi:MAG: VanZ like family protein [Firmicutes bacterium ADurb.Bin193]|nr:MAG: VanZ like family protein [Firmicutes bacterium ADurb.Bin193]
MMRVRITVWGMTVVLMLVIFLFSSQPAEISNNLSKTLTKQVLYIIPGMRLLSEAQREYVATKANNIVRKSAHFMLYFCLGMIVYFSVMFTIYDKSYMVVLSYAMFFCVCYAVTDEVHQLFVPGRGGQLKDVIIDSSGSLLGSMVIALIGVKLNGLKNTFCMNKPQ